MKCRYRPQHDQLLTPREQSLAENSTYYIISAIRNKSKPLDTETTLMAAIIIQ